MKKPPQKTKESLASLLDSQKLAVLSTYSGSRPYVSLVAFAASDDLDRFFFVTARATRKFANILEHPQVALLVDDRSNNDSDFGEASAVTILGKARELTGEGREMQLKSYLRKHPCLEEFATLSTSALVQVQVETFVLVERFQEVTELQLRTQSI